MITTTGNGDLQLKGFLRSHSFPKATVDPVTGHLFVVFNDDPSLANPNDNGGIFITRSTDNGATWSAPTVVDNSPRDQFFPGIASMPGGPLVASYYSRSDDPQNLYYHRRARIVKSLDMDWYPSFQVSPSTPTVLNQDPSFNPLFGALSEGMAGGPRRVSLAWSDNRRGNAFHTNQPDVRFAQITLPPSNANLKITATVDDPVIPVLGNITLTLDVESLTGTANDVFVSGLIPRSFRLQSIVKPPGATCTHVHGHVGCSVGTIPPGAHKLIEVHMRSLGAGVITFPVRATTSSRDIQTANNSDSVTVQITPVATQTTEVSTGNIATPIPDNGQVVLTLPVTLDGLITRIKPSVRINHTYDSDLDFFLVSPSGTRVDLSSDNGFELDNYGSGSNDCSGTPTTFDDFATVPVFVGTPPNAGSRLSEANINRVIRDLNQSGDWKFTVRDDKAGNTGTIGCVKLEFTTQDPP